MNIGIYYKGNLIEHIRSLYIPRIGEKLCLDYTYIITDIFYNIKRYNDNLDYFSEVDYVEVIVEKNINIGED